jgi:hypothetical protein
MIKANQKENAKNQKLLIKFTKPTNKKILFDKNQIIKPLDKVLFVKV